MTIKELIENFAQNSTAHGIPKVVRSTSIIRRIFWIVTCIAAVCIFLTQGSLLLQRFLSYPKSVRVEVANKPVPFPSVSICNLRSLDIHTLVDIFFDENLIFRWNSSQKYSGRVNSSFPAFEHLSVRYSELYKVYRNFAEIYAEKNDVYFLWLSDRDLLSRMTVAANLNVSAAQQGGIKSSEFIARCQYAGDKCTHDDFDWFLDPAYFNCFTFNSSKVVGTEHTMYEGPDNGLSLILFTPSMNIMNITGETMETMAIYQEMTLGGEGIRVVVHRKNTVPYPLTEGLDIPRGVSASLGLKLQENIRIRNPHGNCTDRETLEDSTYTYTAASCKKACLQKVVQKDCNCADVSLPYRGDDTMRFCSEFDDIPENCTTKQNIMINYDYCKDIFMEWFNRVQCMKSTRSNISRNLSAWETCKCTPSCNDMDYDIHYSLSDWPMQEQPKLVLEDILYVDRFKDQFPPPKAEKYFGSLLSPPQQFGVHQDFINKKHFMRLNVYISDTSVLKIVEIEDYHFTQLVSDMGGQLGLWIGVSIITMVETVELVYNIICYVIDKKREVAAEK